MLGDLQKGSMDIRGCFVGEIAFVKGMVFFKTPEFNATTVDFINYTEIKFTSIVFRHYAPSRRPAVYIFNTVQQPAAIGSCC